MEYDPTEEEHYYWCLEEDKKLELEASLAFYQNCINNNTILYI